MLRFFWIFRVVSLVCSGVGYGVGFRFGLRKGITTMIAMAMSTKMTRSSIIVFSGVGVSGEIANSTGFYMFRD